MQKSVTSLASAGGEWTVACPGEASGNRIQLQEDSGDPMTAADLAQGTDSASDSSSQALLSAMDSRVPEGSPSLSCGRSTSASEPSEVS